MKRQIQLEQSVKIGYRCPVDSTGGGGSMIFPVLHPTKQNGAGEPLNSGTIPAGGRKGSKSLLLRATQQSGWEGLILDIQEINSLANSNERGKEGVHRGPLVTYYVELIT